MDPSSGFSLVCREEVSLKVTALPYLPVGITVAYGHALKWNIYPGGVFDAALVKVMNNCSLPSL